LTPEHTPGYKRRKKKKRQQKRPPKNRPPVSDRRAKRIYDERLAKADKEWKEESKFEDDDAFMQRLYNEHNRRENEWTIEDVGSEEDQQELECEPEGELDELEQIGRFEEDCEDDFSFILRLQKEQDMFENFDLDQLGDIYEDMRWEEQMEREDGCVMMDLS
jgi:hypothetical protein